MVEGHASSMTESIRRDGEYETPNPYPANPYQGNPVSPVNPEWPPPPAYRPRRCPRRRNRSPAPDPR